MKCLLLAASVAALGLAACGGGGSAAPTVLPAAAPTAAPTPIIYTALGDSITLGGEASQIGVTNYVALVGAALNTVPANLGQGGMTTGSVNITLPASPAPEQIVYAGVLAAEVPNIQSNANLVSLYIGTNDLILAEAQVLDNGVNEAAFFEQAEAAYAVNLNAIVAGIKARAPNAQLVIMTVPNETYRGGAGDPLPLQQDLTNLDNAMRTAIASSGAVIVDLQCLPAMYNLADFPGPYDVHPNDAGHAAIAQAQLAAIAQHTTMIPATCPWTAPNA
jgi:lysophospholipase L1-like esterase